MPRPPEHESLVAAYEARARALQAFDPELVVIFAPDHYTGVHLQMVPPFCIGLNCEAVDDYGGHPGRLNVPQPVAWGCIESLRSADFDVAVSHAMAVDHGFSQLLQGLAGGLDRYPVLPILINTTCRPVSSFRRVRSFGAAVGRYVKTLGLRTAFIGSGGLSHHPANIFPQDLGSTDPDIARYLLHGGMNGGMGRTEWIAQLAKWTEEGGQKVASGERTAKDFRLNPAWDKQFLEAFAAGKLDVFDAWDPLWVIEQAGVAAMEVQQWIAAAAAAQACGLGAPSIDFYFSGAEYRISVGVAHTSTEATPEKL